MKTMQNIYTPHRIYLMVITQKPPLNFILFIILFFVNVNLLLKYSYLNCFMSLDLLFS